MNMAAEFDPTGTYRYSLSRAWDSNASPLALVMLNPSTVDGTVDDPTIRRCIHFARSWGYGSLEVVNLFAYRATAPSGLLNAADPIGPENDCFILEAKMRASKIIVAWGHRGTLNSRDKAVIRLLSPTGDLYCLGTTHSGHPRHPLYASRGAMPVPFSWNKGI